MRAALTALKPRHVTIHLNEAARSRYATARTPNGGYRTSSGVQRKLRCVTEGRRLVAPDRRIVPVGCHDPDSAGRAQMNRFGTQDSRPPITLSSRGARKRRHALAKARGAWRSSA
jgi:hypothetical protein